MGVQHWGRLTITPPGGEVDPQVIYQSCCPSYEEQKCYPEGWVNFAPAQVIQASCSQTLVPDLSSRASVKTGCLLGLWVGGKYGVQMELGERALGFGPH